MPDLFPSRGDGSLIRTITIMRSRRRVRGSGGRKGWSKRKQNWNEEKAGIRRGNPLYQRRAVHFLLGLNVARLYDVERSWNKSLVTCLIFLTLGYFWSFSRTYPCNDLAVYAKINLLMIHGSVKIVGDLQMRRENVHRGKNHALKKLDRAGRKMKAMCQSTVAPGPLEV